MKSFTSTTSFVNGQHAVRAFPTQRPVRTSRRSLRTRAEAIKVGRCWVVAPPKRQPPRGIVHFLGGAFVSGAPQVLYSLLLESIAASGFTVLSTPYAVSFKHLECAATVRQDFMDSVQELRGNSSQSWMVPAGVPVLGVGHSNGALLHLLNSSQSGQVYTVANVLVSYNNKQVSDAIPIPGFLEALGPTARAAQEQQQPLPVELPSPSAVLETASGLLPFSALGLSQRQVADAGLLLEQLGSVVKEVGDGNSDFTPNPEESRRIVKAGYSPTATPTLLVQFTNDSFDQTPEMLDILLSCDGGAENVQGLTLPGSHITPCGTDLKWQIGAAGFSPQDALIMAVKQQSQVELRRLTQELVDFLGSCCAAASNPPTQPQGPVAGSPTPSVAQ
uniref:Alpha/beta hydrolase fold-3 domain-containing protein n=1 Tax=Dunaliella tertiolecta TaxID=3047 RepID=A0A7S3VIW0_DUNTE|eukprot:CAMPEP_0202389214 /NCGR_PEP_ID=MMETSP1127-20130417/81647_1 /ASSEMBLY_ACC=CAM_ASM_000462 /TAXON_ID=3047 /ORGANISM="Dunaliella tertiolecta, Strain CCMP1320" /LENGTH=388 /DNA_ID=CAMNT_0048990881 /DNA_START=10 /DNA_END=1176 /DNA_ORIENTATION=+